MGFRIAQKRISRSAGHRSTIAKFYSEVMDHLLDNPVWHALNTGNQHLSNGNSNAKYFSREVSPFIGLKEPSVHNFSLLHTLLPYPGFFGFVSPAEIEIPAPWKIHEKMDVLQMVHDLTTSPGNNPEGLIRLTDEHIPEMLALTKLTNPGPFARRTIDFGNYRGIFRAGKLVAMAGQRMHPSPYHEVSAVCTHPDHHGNGFASRLIGNQIHHIISRGEIPFLHVKSDNAPAIRVYERLGFATRKAVFVYILRLN